MNHKVVLLILLVLIVACKANDSEPNNKTVKVNEETDFNYLYAGYYENPTHRDQVEQNKIIEYATENELPLRRTESGLYYMISEKGLGPNLKWGEKLKVDYSGYFLDGREFDSSYKRGEALEFQLGQMITGWNEGLRYFQSGAKGKLFVPSRLAYGTAGHPTGIVPPNTVVAFDIHVIY